MRRVPALLLLVALAVLTVPGAALADEAGAGDGSVVLAAEADPGGPEPMERDAEDNPATTLSDYGDRETPFTWGAAWLLLFLGAAGLVVMLGVYRLLVRGPR